MKIKTLLAMGLCAAIGLMSVSAFAAEGVSKPGHDEWKAPPLAARKANPIPSDEKTIGLGKALYAGACSVCHGEKGKGDGPAAPALERDGKKIPPSNLSDSKIMRRQTDGELFWKISEGKSPMPAYAEPFSEEQRWQMVNYIRTLAPKPSTQTGASQTPTTPSPAKPPAKAEAAKPSVEPPKDQAVSEKYVTREEYNKLLNELATIKAQLNTTQTNVVTRQSETEATFNDYDKQFKGLNSLVNKVAPGSTKMLLTGYGAGTFQTTSHGYGPAQPLSEISDDPRRGTSTFSASFSPIFLWHLNERTLFESELSLEVGSGGASSSELEYAQVTYILNDYVTFGAGKFLNPINFFIERLHPWWIDKLPDRPLAVFKGLLPEAVLGAEIRGGVPVGPTKFEYAFFVGNSPTLKTPDNDLQRGLMNSEDLSVTRVSPGGRVGFFPIPQLEIGYGFQIPNLGNGVGGLLQTVDLNYQQDCPYLKGTFDLKAEWVWSQLDPNTVDAATGDTVRLPAGLSNNRNGGYVQLAYRPSKLDGFLKNIETVFRYDMLNQKNTAVGFDERRYTIGLNYWLTSSSLVKAAYEIDRQNGTGQNGNAFLLQYAIGF